MLGHQRYFPKQTGINVIAPLPGYFTKLCAKIGIRIPSEYTTVGVWKDGVEVKNVVQDFIEQQRLALQSASPDLLEPTPESESSHAAEKA